jgi:ADP-ribose pyrophosphatase YjhB (NUDIX family)
MVSNHQEEKKSIHPDWLKWAREIQAISQTGLHFAENHYQEERFSRLLEISAEIISTHSNLGRSGTMPGGWADVGDVPSEAVEREVLEESGFDVKARKVIGLYDANRTGPLEIFHAYKIVFLCDIVSGEPRVSDETSEVAFFDKKNIPTNLSGERTRTRHIHDAFQAISEDRPTRFD